MNPFRWLKAEYKRLRASYDLDRLLKTIPEFNPATADEIIEWAKKNGNLELYWNDTFGNEIKGYKKRPELAHWGFSWKYGFIGFMTLKREKEDAWAAEIATALFLYLWAHEIPTWICDHVAEAFARSYAGRFKPWENGECDDDRDAPSYDGRTATDPRVDGRTETNSS